MKYLSENRLFEFVFHDSIFSSAEYADGRLTLNAEFLNLSKNSVLNEHDYDMQIGTAVITFENFAVERFEAGMWWKKPLDEEYDPFLPDEPGVIKGEAALNLLLEELSGEVTVYEFGIHDSGYHYMNASGLSGWFEARFLYHNVTVEWDEFVKPAWYEKTK